MSKIVQSGQSLMDKAIELTGSVDNSFAMSVANGLSITDDLEVGVPVSETGLFIPSIIEFFTGAACSLATAYLPEPNQAAPKGIDYWAIGSTFIIT